MSLISCNNIFILVTIFCVRDTNDVNGGVTEKDVLPAYEFKGGPPNYSQPLAVG